MKNELNLINWAEMSRLLSGSPQNIRPKYIPQKYKPSVHRLANQVRDWSEGCEDPQYSPYEKIAVAELRVIKDLSGDVRFKHLAKKKYDIHVTKGAKRLELELLSLDLGIFLEMSVTGEPDKYEIEIESGEILTADDQTFKIQASKLGMLCIEIFSDWIYDAKFVQ